MTACAEEMLEEWNAKARQGQPLDIAQEMMRLTLRIVSKTLFSREVGADSEKMGRAGYGQDNVQGHL